jgi:transposase
MAALVLPWANSQMMSMFLRHVSELYPKHFILMLVDGAGWHVSKSLEVPENIRLIKQPPHSPELNPVEHIWEELREKHFHNKALNSLDQVEAQLCKGLLELMDDPGKVRSMTNFPYLRKTTH